MARIGPTAGRERQLQAVEVDYVTPHSSGKGSAYPIDLEGMLLRCGESIPVGERIRISAKMLAGGRESILRCQGVVGSAAPVSGAPAFDVQVRFSEVTDGLEALLEAAASPDSSAPAAASSSPGNGTHRRRASERRSWARLQRALQVEVCGDGIRGAGFTLDIGIGGIFLQFAGPQMEGRWLRLRFYVPAAGRLHLVQCVGRVVRQLKPRPLELPGIAVVFRSFDAGFEQFREFLMARLQVPTERLGAPDLEPVPADAFATEPTWLEAPDDTLSPSRFRSRVEVARPRRRIQVEVITPRIQPPSEPVDHRPELGAMGEETWEAYLREFAKSRDSMAPEETEPGSFLSADSAREPLLPRILERIGWAYHSASVRNLFLFVWMAFLVLLAVHVVYNVYFFFI